jgi:phospholipid transport system substrate-binding protein
VTAALVLVLFTDSGTWAATTPTDALRQVFRQADKILTDPGTRERPLDRLLAVRQLVNEAFDVRSAAELASGDHWRARTAAEQEEFTWLFGDLLERAFVSRMSSGAGLDGGMRIRYLNESVDGGSALVQTAMARRDGGEMLLDYRLIDREGAWKIRDVAIDGVSVMANYRAQLDRVLGNASFPELLTQMRAKVGTVDAPTRTASPSSGETSPTAGASLPGLHTPAVPPSPVAALEPVGPAPPAAPAPRAIPDATSPAPRQRTTKAYWLRISTLDSVHAAARLAARLRDRKLRVALERTSAGGTLKVQVRVGPFVDVEEAVLKLLDLQARGHDPYLVAERE